MTAQAEVELASGIPFVSDAQLEAGLAEAGVDATTSAAIVDENAEARLDGLRAALAVLAVLALVAFLTSGNLPTRQPGAEAAEDVDVSPPAVH